MCVNRVETLCKKPNIWVLHVNNNKNIWMICCLLVLLVLYFFWLLLLYMLLFYWNLAVTLNTNKNKNQKIPLRQSFTSKSIHRAISKHSKRFAQISMNGSHRQRSIVLQVFLQKKSIRVLNIFEFVTQFWKFYRYPIA